MRHTPNPQEVVALAAKLCYSPAAVEDLERKVASGDIKEYLQKIVSLGHHSVLEHASFSFAIEGISRATSHQLVRHRLASYSQQSQRYVTHKGPFPYTIPPTITKVPRLKERFLAAMEAANELYHQLLAAKVPAEDARYVLPNATHTKIIVTMNARELRHFFNLRCCSRAQWEIRQMALLMLKAVQSIAPLLFADAGPGCLLGDCPEGEMTCGKPWKKPVGRKQ